MARDASEIRAELEAEADRHRQAIAVLLADLPACGEDTPVIRAIFEMLYESTHRLTGGVFLGALCPKQDRGERGFSERNITDTLTALVRAGRLTNHVRDPGDGYARGYGLPEWDQK